MIYQIGSKMFKAVVVLAMGTYACGNHGGCGGHHAAAHDHAHTHTHGAHDLADSGNVVTDSELDAMDNSDDGKNNAPPQQKPPTAEEFEAAKTGLELSEDDVATVLSYVSRIPPMLKHKDYSDEQIAQMFVHHYWVSPDSPEEQAKGDLEPKSRTDLLEEVKHLVEVEIPQMMGQQAPQKPTEATDSELDRLDDEDKEQVDVATTYTSSTTTTPFTEDAKSEL